MKLWNLLRKWFDPSYCVSCDERFGVGHTIYGYQLGVSIKDDVITVEELKENRT